MLALKYQDKLLEVGTDEAGRGCLSGPVVAAAVILPDDFEHSLLNDSKKLSEKQRKVLRIYIEEKAIAWNVAFIDEKVIDKINILQASIKAMHESIRGLKVKPKFIVVDGNKFHPYEKIPHQTIVKGDGKYMNIAAASILAKTYRDDFMEAIDKEFPMYYWKQNKGYPTKAHREAIRLHGITKYHRTTFRLLPEQFTLDL